MGATNQGAERRQCLALSKMPSITANFPAMARRPLHQDLLCGPQQESHVLLNSPTASCSSFFAPLPAPPLARSSATRCALLNGRNDGLWIHRLVDLRLNK